MQGAREGTPTVCGQCQARGGHVRGPPWCAGSARHGVARKAREWEALGGTQARLRPAAVEVRGGETWLDLDIIRLPHRMRDPGDTATHKGRDTGTFLSLWGRDLHKATGG